MNQPRVPWRRIAALAVALMLAGCGSGGGDTEADADATTTARAPGAGAESSGSSSTTTEVERLLMPDVMGMSEDEALAELRDRGVETSTVTVDERESLDQPGLVIDQVPASGLDISGSVNLVIAKPISPLPDFVGSQISELRDWAEERDLQVRESEVLDDTLPEGQVVATTPAAGQVPSSEIAVQVATKPIIEAFADLDPTQQTTYSLSTGEATIDGQHHQNSVVAKIGQGDPDFIEYDMGRDWERVKATLGFQDDSRSSAQARVQIFVDDKEVFNQIVSFGQSFEVDIDVRDVLRLKFQMTSIDTTIWEDRIVYGNLRRIGRPGGSATPNP